MNERLYGPCWEAICDGCGQANRAIWQLEEPADNLLPDCGWCDGACTWNFIDVPQVVVGRMSGFSTSESDFVPHYNSSLGCKVESLAHMKRLQATKGAEDAVVKGDGLERHAPRDVLETAKRAAETRRRLAAGETIDYGHGVSARMEP